MASSFAPSTSLVPDDSHSYLLTNTTFTLLILFSISCLIVVFIILFVAVNVLVWSPPPFGARFRRFRQVSLRQPENHPGLTKSAIASLPTFIFARPAITHADAYATGGDASFLECAVCLNQFDDGEQGRMLPDCHHSFHIECIDMWLSSHPTCPLCRTEIRSNVPISLPNTQILSSSDEHRGGEEAVQPSAVHDGTSINCYDPSGSNVVEEGSSSIPSRLENTPSVTVFKQSCGCAHDQPSSSLACGYDQRRRCLAHITIEIPASECQILQSPGRSCISLPSERSSTGSPWQVSPSNSIVSPGGLKVSFKRMLSLHASNNKMLFIKP
ncbi:hypothetical protein KP509_22G061600 [Ceratopteris richardii]|uniref:RING-type E3 ubiquitin transferase n=1 Tax=Ceratopteris richardii TaxID=49495 RepID=A0A8T2S922_CERRI|nr:hypothetical protein KP509_22G061600 [Ceratopteris richardii]